MKETFKCVAIQKKHIIMYVEVLNKLFCHIFRTATYVVDTAYAYQHQEDTTNNCILHITVVLYSFITGQCHVV